MDLGSWIAFGALAVAAGSLLVTVWGGHGNIKRAEMNQRDQARVGYVDEIKAELELFRQKFADAEHHMKTCEEDLRQLRRDYNTMKGQNFALMQMLLPRTPLVVVQPDGSGVDGA